MQSMRRPSSGSILFMITLFYVLAFSIIFINSPETDYRGFIVAGGAVGLLYFQYGALTAFFPNVDRYVLLVANFLCAVGMVMLYRIDPDIAIKQLVWMGIGMFFMVITMLAIRYWRAWPNLKWVLMVGSFGLLALSIVFSGSVFGAKNWFTIAGVTVQPSEFVKVLLVVALAGVLHQYNGFSSLLVIAGYVGGCLILLLLQKDLGAALLYAGTAIIMLYAGTSNKWLVGGAVGAVSVGSVLAYKLFPHVRVRVALWQNPWALYESQGYQVVQGLIAIASGGLFGLGLTMGMPMAVPVRHTDFIFAVICEEFGLIIGVALVAFYLVFIVRGAIIAMDARNSFDAIMAIGCVAMITLQCFINIGGVVKLIPLTGITLPFVSYGGSSMLSCFILLGILEGIAIKNGDADSMEFDEELYDEDDYAYDQYED
ncbi:FtsW/RodA/SpoVE family cell cycle protein [Christensenella sp. MSJ-20]|uniref:FtsW/RodA/SpoVE family cell cycle protein n=1 Tax=Christensenella sp. MSJ-20 TaxID=2841518 RepID=UPI000D7A2BEF|nr:MAG: cell division protein FtsW [Bacillota bacterium]QWT55212.1 FtsW/RodA/SpoVE family cell cycle protein [Christensenella sp. MSJ-20]